jgi:methylthioribose-1-phosphate isomerase
MQRGIDVTLICDNMAARVMNEMKIDAVLVGADRIARNGDTANKIGTLGLAVLATEFCIPFYVLAPSTTIDQTITNGVSILIEERLGDEVSCLNGIPIAPQGVAIYNPAFDVTPARYISAIINEKEIFRAPYDFG